MALIGKVVLADARVALSKVALYDVWRSQCYPSLNQPLWPLELVLI